MHINLCLKMEPLYIEDCVKLQLNSKGWYLQGFSRAGDRTGFILYPQKFIFDCGIRTNICCENIFMTHVHTDHSLELPVICNRHKVRDKPDFKYNIFLPSSSVENIKLLVRCVSQLSFPESRKQSNEEILSHQKIKLNAINAGDEFIIKDNLISVFESHHTIQAVGYGISSISKKLKPEYLALFNDESIDKKERIKKFEVIKKSGTETYEQIIIPEVVFFCDSSIHNLSNHDEWQSYPVIVCECTGLSMNKKSEQDFLNDGHTCITQLLPIIETYPDKKWILIHITTALNSAEIKKIELDLRLKTNNNNIYIWSNT